MKKLDRPLDTLEWTVLNWACHTGAPGYACRPQLDALVEFGLLVPPPVTSASDPDPAKSLYRPTEEGRRVWQNGGEP